eukprot:340427_1
MKRSLKPSDPYEDHTFEPPSKKQKMKCHFDDDMKYDDTHTQSNCDTEFETFCPEALEKSVLSEFNEEKRKESERIVNIDIKIFESGDYVHVDGKGPCILAIKEELKRIGFRWKRYLWTMKRCFFVSDYELFIRNLLEEACHKHHFTLFVFDFEYNAKRKQKLIQNINVSILYDGDVISIRTNIDEEEMITCLKRHKYTLSEYGDDGMNIYNKKGILYEGHLRTWRGYAVMYHWILGYREKDIRYPPHCIDCNGKLCLHTVKKPGANQRRKFYNCNACYFGTKKARRNSFLWADGDMEKVSDLFVQQHLTQPFSQIAI